MEGLGTYYEFLSEQAVDGVLQIANDGSIIRLHKGLNCKIADKDRVRVTLSLSATGEGSGRDFQYGICAENKSNGLTIPVTASAPLDGVLVSTYVPPSIDANAGFRGVTSASKPTDLVANNWTFTLCAAGATKDVNSFLVGDVYIGVQIISPSGSDPACVPAP